MEKLDKKALWDAMTRYWIENCRCGNAGVDGDLWRGGGYEGWVACEACSTNHYFLNDLGYYVQETNLLIERGYL